MPIPQMSILTLSGAPVTDFLLQYGLFLAKTLTWVIALLVVTAGLASAVRAAREQRGQEHLEIKSLNERFQNLAADLQHRLLPPDAFKVWLKQQRKEEKRRLKLQGKDPQQARRRLFVLDFDGDIRASAVDHLREEISALLQVARSGDEVLLRLESEGGMVHAYGLAASQLRRVRDRQLRLTVAVDKVAASGGYMMACVADRILAAPFAVVGSIGVVAQLPNFSKLLKKHEVDYELHTAGEYKRTLTVFGENTDEGRAKFREELEDTHQLFKDFVITNRPVLDLAQVATGEHWFGLRALELKLVDELRTSDDFLLAQLDSTDLVQLSYSRRHSLSERLAHGLGRLAATLGIQRPGLGRY